VSLSKGNIATIRCALSLSKDYNEGLDELSTLLALGFGWQPPG
jgi:hypothetical protein